MKLLTKFLRFVLVILIFLLALIFWFLFPDLITTTDYSFRGQQVFFTIGLYLSGLISYGIIYLTWKLLNLTDQHRIFSSASLHSVQMIKRCFYTITVIYTLLIPVFSEILSDDYSPVGLFMNGFLISVALTLGVFTNVLERILRSITRPSSTTHSNIEKEPSL